MGTNLNFPEITELGDLLYICIGKNETKQSKPTKSKQMKNSNTEFNRLSSWIDRATDFNEMEPETRLLYFFLSLCINT